MNDAVNDKKVKKEVERKEGKDIQGLDQAESKERRDGRRKREM